MYAFDEQQLSVDQAIEVLNTSLDPDEIGRALSDLYDARELAAPAAPVLARMLAQNPDGIWTGLALGATGEACIPYVGKLVQNGFEWAVTCGQRTVTELPPGLDDELWAVLDPANTRPERVEGTFNALMVMGYYDLKPATANRIVRRFLTEGRPVFHAFAVLYLGGKVSDPALFDLIEASGTRYNRECMAYLGARLRADHEARESREPAPKVPAPLTEQELEHQRQVDAAMTALAKPAVQEVLKNLEWHANAGAKNSDFNQYFWLRMLRALARDAAIPKERTLGILKAIQRQRGSWIDREIIDMTERLRLDESIGFR